MFCQAQASFQVSPAKLYFTQKASGEQTTKLHIRNTSGNRLVLQSSCVDWRRDSLGVKVYYKPGALPTSCCTLVRVTPSVIDMAPGEERDVLVTMLADDRPATAIRNSMLLLTQANEQEVAKLTGNASQFIIKVEIGVHVYLLPEATAQPDIAITNMEVVQSAKPYHINVQVHNNGGTLLESQLRLEYLNLETMEELKTEPVPVNTMPRDDFRVVANVPPSLKAGKYLIVAVLDSGQNHALKVAELETVLK